MIETTLDGFLNFGLEDKTIRAWLESVFLKHRLIDQALAIDRSKHHTTYYLLNEVMKSVREDIIKDKDKIDIRYIKKFDPYLVLVYPNKNKNSCLIDIAYLLT